MNRQFRCRVIQFSCHDKKAICGRHSGCFTTGVPEHQPDPQTFQVIGAAMEVHRQLHCGLYEGFYCEALAVEFSLRHIPFEAQRAIQLEYKGQLLKGVYHLDFICFDSVVVEVKAVSALSPADESQLLNYLAMTRLQRGLLINFGSKSLEYKRRVLQSVDRPS